MAVKRGLGRGYKALISEDEPVESAGRNEAGVARVPIGQIRGNTWQPRQSFDRTALDELAASIKEHGVLQPLLVRGAADGFELIAGERRLRAAGEAGLTEVPVIVMEAGEQAALELALIENLQREDLNVLEEADAYQALADRFGLTQEQIAARVGKARASVTNTMRLLGLPAEVKRLLADGHLTPGHAKLLTGLDDAQDQLLYARRTVDSALSVRNLEAMLQRVRRAPRRARTAQLDIPRDHLTYLSDKLHAHFGTGVHVVPCRTYANGKKGKGSIEIEFYSNDDLDRILQILGVTED